MSALIAIAYPNLPAETVRSKLLELTVERSIELEDAVIVDREPDGKLKLHQAQNTAATGAVGGALCGGLILLAPLLGTTVGAAAGGPTGALADVGVPNDHLKDSGTSSNPARRG
jgi:uncharacterized membrane protein